MMKKKNTISRLNKIDYSIFIICSILAVFMFYLFYEDMNSFSIKQDESPIAKINLKENTVQRKFSNRNIYEKVSLDTNIYDGDTLRTADKSKVSAEFLADNANVVLNENSMIQFFQNKKKDSINFLSGEIQLKNNSKKKTIVLQTGIKEIAIKEDSEVKVAVQNIQNEYEDSKEAVIDVVSGEVEISDIKEVTKAKKEKESKKQKISAGETASFKFVDFSSDVLNQIAQNVKQESVIENNIEENKEVEIIENIESGVSGEQLIGSTKFTYFMYNPEAKLYNYGISCTLSDLLGKNKRIPKGSAIEVTVSGIPDNFINNFAIQISTGEDNWDEADSFRWESMSEKNGALKGEKFVEKRIVIVRKEIKNTSKASLGISYEPYLLDKEVNVKDFEVKARVVTKNVNNKIVTLAPNFYKEFKFDTANLGKDNDSYVFSVNAENVFGDYVTIPKGTKLKLHIEGATSKNINWLEVVLVNDVWKSKIVKNPENLDDINLIDTEIQKDVPFIIEKVYTFIDDLPISNEFSFKIYFNSEEKGYTPLKNCKISLQTVE